jgi:ATP-grasp domain
MACRVLLAATVPWPSVARYAGGFAAAGCEVDALSPAKAPITASRYLKRHHRYRPLSALPSWRAAIAASAPDLIVACDDRAVTQMLRLYAQAKKESPLAALIERSLGTPESCRRIMARTACMRIARSIGIRVPDTYAIVDEAGLDAALAAIGYPAVLKADGTWGGDGVRVVKSRDDALAAFRKLSKRPSRLRSLARALKRRDAHYLLTAIVPPTPAVSIQRFIEGTPANSAFAAWKGEVVGSIYYDVLVADGAIGPPNVIRRIDDPEIDRATRLAAKHFGLSGIHGMDFIRDRDGQAHLIEINPRATQGGTLAFGPGHDLPAALAACVSPTTTMRAAIANDVVAIFPREWQRDPASPYLKTGHHDVPWDDPAVFRASLGLST